MTTVFFDQVSIASRAPRGVRRVGENTSSASGGSCFSFLSLKYPYRKTSKRKKKKPNKMFSIFQGRTLQMKGATGTQPGGRASGAAEDTV